MCSSADLTAYFFVMVPQSSRASEVRTNFDDGNNGEISNSSPLQNDPTLGAAMTAATPSAPEEQVIETKPEYSNAEAGMSAATPSPETKQTSTTAAVSAAAEAAMTASKPSTKENPRARTTAAPPTTEAAMKAVLRTASLKVINPLVARLRATALQPIIMIVSIVPVSRFFNYSHLRLG